MAAMTPLKSPPDPLPDYFRELTASAAVLSAVAGYVNAVTIAGVLHVPSTHMSGTTTRLSVDVVGGLDASTLLFDVALIGAFVLGAAVSGAILDSTQLRVGRRYGMLLVLESLVLTLAWLILNTGSRYYLPVIGLAAGLQNALATQYSRATVRTTHMTGILTDLGIALGKWISRRGVTHWRVALYLAIFIGFLVGGAGGAAMSLLLHDHALLVPIAVTGLGGALYWTWQYRWVRGAAGRVLPFIRS